MEAPPLSTPPPIPANTNAASPLYPDSVDSSPRSRLTDFWDADAAPLQPPPKLRFMCSYGGHIIPRPHDKTLCYIGGDTRIIVIDRQTSLSNLQHRLSKNLLNNQPFSLKYQLPSEELDSLISVSTDEDLENMVDEYERLSNAGGGSKRGRIRLFLFPKSSSSIEQVLVETASTKSEDWFFNALNGKASMLSTAAASDRGFSETSSVNCLLGLDDDFVGKTRVVERNSEPQNEEPKIGGNGNVSGNYVITQDVHSIPDSSMLDTTSSFGSTSSSPSVANLPKLGALGIEEQFQQMSVGIVGNVNLPSPQKRDDIGGFMAAGVAPGPVVSGLPVVVGSDYLPNRIFSDDERSDHGGYRKVQQTQRQVQAQNQPQQKPTSAFDLPSPNSLSRVESEGMGMGSSVREAASCYEEQEPVIQIQSNQSVDQYKESGYVLSSQFVKPQYIPGAVPISSSYYPVFPSQHQHHPVYLVSSRPPTQAYNLPPPANYNQPPTQYIMHHPSYEFADHPTRPQMYYTPQFVPDDSTQLQIQRP